MKKILLLSALCFFMQQSVSLARNLYHGIDIDEVYNNSDWHSKDDIKQLADAYALLQKIKKDFAACPQEIPENTICYDLITKQLLKNFYKNFEKNWKNYTQLKKLAETNYAVPFCENKFSGTAGLMCHINARSSASDVVKAYTATLLHSTEDFFKDYDYFLRNYK